MPHASPIWSQPIHSSLIASAAYHPTLQFLDLQLHDGARYRYLRVPACIYADLIRAASIGRFFNRNIKNGFSFVRC